MLRDMAAAHGKTVVLTIHQPGFRILELIDRVVLLADGAVRHHGSLDFLQSRLIATGHDIPAHVNVLEYAMETIDSLKPDVAVATAITTASANREDDVAPVGPVPASARRGVRELASGRGAHPGGALHEDGAPFTAAVRGADGAVGSRWRVPRQHLPGRH
jgi:hypothetical protein